MSEILIWISDVVAIIRAETTAKRLDAALALSEKMAKVLTPTITFDDNLVAWVQGNQAAKDTMIGIIDRWFATAIMDQAHPNRLLSMGAMQEDDVRRVEAEGFDAFEWLELIRFIVDLLSRLQVLMSDPMIAGSLTAVNGNTVEMTPDGGTPNYRHRVLAGANVTLNGVDAKVADLLPGDRLMILGDPAVLVEAKRAVPYAAQAKVQEKCPHCGKPSSSSPDCRPWCSTQCLADANFAEAEDANFAEAEDAERRRLYGLAKGPIVNAILPHPESVPQPAAVAPLPKVGVPDKTPKAPPPKAVVPPPAVPPKPQPPKAIPPQPVKAAPPKAAPPAPSPAPKPEPK